jgi:hypothetical protein
MPKTERLLPRVDDVQATYFGAQVRAVSFFGVGVGLAVCRIEPDGAVAIQEQASTESMAIGRRATMGARRDGIGKNGDGATRDEAATITTKMAPPIPAPPLNRDG